MSVAFYPKVDRSLCVDCNLCNKVCPLCQKAF
ncbi:MAG: 4Fe-4S binding protein [Faecalibacterium prausnitzii]